MSSRPRKVLNSDLSCPVNRHMPSRKWLTPRHALAGLLLLFATNMAMAEGPSCKAVFSTGKAASATRYGMLRPEFRHERTYSVDLEKQSSVKDQCSLGTCHLHSWVSHLERNAVVEHNQSIKISTHYLSARHWFERSMQVLSSASAEGVEVSLGASVLMSRDSILKFGLIPDSAWTGKRDFQSAPLSARITEFITNITARAKWRAAREIDPQKREEILSQAKSQIAAIFQDVIGEVPDRFEFKGKTHTPNSFMNEYFPELAKPLVVMMVARAEKGKTRVEELGADTVVLTSVDTAAQTARRLLDDGKNVYLAYSHARPYVDSKTGIMSISAFRIPDGAEPLTREQRDHFEIDTGGHAVQLVGYDADPATGRISKWKIKNSWGDKSGDNGYYHMYDDYFRAFVKGVSFAKDAGIDLPVSEINRPKQLALPFN